MAVTTQLAAVTAAAIQEGKYALNRVWRVEASVAAPVAESNLSNIISVEVGEPSFNENEYFMQGAGDERLTLRRNYKWPITINVYKGKLGETLETLLGLTWSSDFAIPLRDNTTLPSVHWEAVCRDSDNTTHLFSLVIQDLILNMPAFPNPLDYSDSTITGYTYHDPFLLYSGYEMEYDIFTTDGSGTDYTASSTPVSLVTNANYDDWSIDEAASIKLKASGETVGTREKSGWTYSTGVFTRSTAAAVSGNVQILYAKATS